ncbi:MAG TPA: VWA domain-containing protein [Bryobacteraceae bacterium]|nr:VWA domain-containing protein [Bryobacteraceae bacterium]
MQDLRTPDFTTTTNVVNIFATVRNKEGELVANLGKDDFLLQDQGQPESIRYFSRRVDLPLALGLLLDTSRSMLTLLPAENTASFRFFQNVMRADEDTAFLLSFDLDVRLLQGLTASKPSLENALNQLKIGTRWEYGGGRGLPDVITIKDGTHLYDAICVATDKIMQKQLGRKALIVLSDGVDMGSKNSLTNAVESAQRSDTLVYSILFSDSNAYSRRALTLSHTIQRGHPGTIGKEVLRLLSRETGGRSFELSKQMSLDRAYALLGQELRSQYSLGYTPQAATSSGHYHKIRVTTKDKSLVVQARDGYYSPESAARRP